MYTVKSAYKLLSENHRHAQVMDYVSSSNHQDYWKKVWKLKVPPKVRIFWWRVLHEFLPTQQIMHPRHIEQVPTCTECGADSESIYHVSLECIVAKQFWFSLKELMGIKVPLLHPDT